MSTDADSKPAKPDYNKVMEDLVLSQRLAMQNGHEIDDTHLMPSDWPPIPHRSESACWCHPEVVHKTDRWTIYKHRRQQ